jgi:hypothetical protein
VRERDTSFRFIGAVDVCSRLPVGPNNDGLAQRHFLLESDGESGDNDAFALTVSPDQARSRCYSHLVGPRFGGAFFVGTFSTLPGNVRAQHDLASRSDRSSRTSSSRHPVSAAAARRDSLGCGLAEQGGVARGPCERQCARYRLPTGDSLSYGSPGRRTRRRPGLFSRSARKLPAFLFHLPAGRNRSRSTATAALASR